MTLTNVQITPGAGAPIATELKDGAHYQIMKLDSDDPAVAALGKMTGASNAATVSGPLTSAASSAPFTPIVGRPFNVTLSGTFTAMVTIERTFDNGSTWHPVTAAGYPLYAFSGPVSEQLEESEPGVKYRVRCTSYTSGTINYRLSQ